MQNKQNFPLRAVFFGFMRLYNTFAMPVDTHTLDINFLRSEYCILKLSVIECY